MQKAPAHPPRPSPPGRVCSPPRQRLQERRRPPASLRSCSRPRPPPYTVDACLRGRSTDRSLVQGIYVLGQRTVRGGMRAPGEAAAHPYLYGNQSAAVTWKGEWGQGVSVAPSDVVMHSTTVKCLSQEINQLFLRNKRDKSADMEKGISSCRACGYVCVWSVCACSGSKGKNRKESKFFFG